jgi:hypothetical protein
LRAGSHGFPGRRVERDTAKLDEIKRTQPPSSPVRKTAEAAVINAKASVEQALKEVVTASKARDKLRVVKGVGRKHRPPVFDLTVRNGHPGAHAGSVS